MAFFPSIDHYILFTKFVSWIVGQNKGNGRSLNSFGKNEPYEYFMKEGRIAHYDYMKFGKKFAEKFI